MERSYDRFDFHVIEDGMDAMLAPDPAHPVAPEWHRGIEDMVAIDPYCPGLDRPRKSVCGI